MFRKQCISRCITKSHSSKVNVRMDDVDIEKPEKIDKRMFETDGIMADLNGAICTLIPAHISAIVMAEVDRVVSGLEIKHIQICLSNLNGESLIRNSNC